MNLRERIAGWLDRLTTKDLSITHVDDGTGFIPAGYGSRPWYGGADKMMDANVVMSPVNWILRNFTEAMAIVERRVQQLWVRDDDHELAQRLARPNEFYGESLLWKATVLSRCFDGNAYWRKIRNVYGGVLGYVYLPHFLVEPKWPEDGSVFISHYQYAPFGLSTHPIDIPVRDIVHFRDGLDPRNVRKGMSALKPLLREVCTDEEASSFAATILGNMGVPGGVIAPSDKDALPSADDVKDMKEYMRSFAGQRRGEWLVLGAPTQIAQFGFDPNNLMLGNLRDISEERVCAALGVPAAVVGFGSGLQQTKVGATMRELRKEAWDSCIRPMQNDMAKQLGQQTLPDFVTNVRRYRVRFDASDFAASQEDETNKAKRVALLVEKGILRVDRAQQMLGLEVDPDRAVYVDTAAATPAGETHDDDNVPPAIAARTNGTGEEE